MVAAVPALCAGPKVTLLFDPDQGFGNGIVVHNDQVALKLRYDVCVIVNPMVADRDSPTANFVKLKDEPVNSWRGSEHARGRLPRHLVRDPGRREPFQTLRKPALLRQRCQGSRVGAAGQDRWRGGEAEACHFERR